MKNMTPEKDRSENYWLSSWVEGFRCHHKENTHTPAYVDHAKIRAATENEIQNESKHPMVVGPLDFSGQPFGRR